MDAVRFFLATSSLCMSVVIDLTIASASDAFSRIRLTCSMSCWQESDGNAGARLLTAMRFWITPMRAGSWPWLSSHWSVAISALSDRASRRKRAWICRCCLSDETDLCQKAIRWSHHLPAASSEEIRSVAASLGILYLAPKVMFAPSVALCCRSLTRVAGKRWGSQSRPHCLYDHAR